MYHLSIEAVAFAAGFGSVRRLNTEIRRRFARTPTELRRVGRQRGPADPGCYRFRLAYRPPYDWAAVTRFLAARATPGVEHVDAASYLRAIEVDGQHGALRVAPAASGEALDVEVRFPDPRALLGLVERVRGMFDLAADPAVIAEHLGADPLLRGRLARHAGVRSVGTWDGFELAVTTLLGSRHAAAAVAAAFGSAVDASPLVRVFPGPARLVDAPLERVGVAEKRAAGVRALAREVAAGRVRFAGVDAATLSTSLASVPGIGIDAATATFFAARAVGEPDAFDARDLGLRRAAGEATRAGLEDRSAAWSPWRAYAAMLLWQEGDEGTPAMARSGSGSGARRGGRSRPHEQRVPVRSGVQRV